MKPFRILHTADLQLGKQQYGSFLRTQDFAAVLPQIVKIAKDEMVDLIALAGDVFDSYSPDSYSERALRKFVEEVGEIERVPCSDSAPAILAIEGNHEFDKQNRGGREFGRIDAVTDGVLRPYMANVFTAINGTPIKIVAADWMPASKLQAFLDALPSDLDILVLHQSCEGFIPNIGSTELTQEQLQGKAKLILLGDLHVQKSIILQDGTIILYPGSTEMCAANEPHQKSVNVIDYDLEKREVIIIRQIPLQTRPIIQPRVFDALSLDSADIIIRARAEQNPIILLEHNAAMRPLVEQKMAEWQALGLTLLFADPIVTIDKAESYVATRDSAEREMETILTNALEDPAEQAATGALWKTPGAAPEIIAELERSIRASHS